MNTVTRIAMNSSTEYGRIQVRVQVRIPIPARGLLDPAGARAGSVLICADLCFLPFQYRTAVLRNTAV